MNSRESGEVTRREAFLVGHFPPPITGVSVINEYMAGVFRKNDLVGVRVNLTPRRVGGPLYGLRRTCIAFRSMVGLRAFRHASTPVLYMAVDGGFGLLFNVMIAFVARLYRYRTFIHHHSFAYINKYFWLVKVLLGVLPKGATHVFLCRDMAEKFEHRYATAWQRTGAQAFILSNAFIIEPAELLAQPKVNTDRTTIGHLSNLCAAKGSHLFLDLFELMSGDQPHLEAVMAGPIVDDSLKVRIERLTQLYSGRLRWIGPVADIRKKAFFEEIDFFVFPTLYENEAQPLVLFEALSHGVPVISMRRGCIASDIDDDVGVIAFNEADFMARAPSFIRAREKDPSGHARLRSSARALAAKVRAEACESLLKLIDVMKGHETERV